MGAERPERVLLGPQLAQVEAVAVDVVDVAELAGVHQVLEPLEAGVVLEQVAHHQRAPGGAGRLHHGLGLLGGLGERLLDEAVLAGPEHAKRERGVGGHRGGDHHGVELGIVQQVVERRGGARAREARRHAVEHLLVAVTDPAQLGVGQTVEVAGQVRPPVAEPDHADLHRAAHVGTRPPQAATTASTCSSPSSVPIGRARVVAASSSVTGSSGPPAANDAIAGWRWIGVR